MDTNTTIIEQIKLLADWNKENINVKPEQVRLNTQTIIEAIQELKRL